MTDHPEGAARVIRGNALDLPLADDSVDLVITSPPYFALRSYQDSGEHYDGQIGAESTPTEFVDALIAATREMVRVVKPSGSIFVNLGDKYAGSGGNNQGGIGGSKRGPSRYSQATDVRAKSLMGLPWRYAIRCIDELGLILRAEIIWAKPNGLPESVTDRVRRSHEQWFHFTIEPRYFSAIDEIREPYTAPPAKAQRSKFVAAGQSKNPGIQLDHDLTHNPLGKLPGSVWTVATEPLKVPESLGIDHFAAFPTEWPRRIILGWSPDSGTVLDPFGGTGTTAAVAKALGRDGISVDMSADYCRLAEWRTNGDGYDKVRARVTKRTYGKTVKRKRAPATDTDAQPSLFDQGDAAA